MKKKIYNKKKFLSGIASLAIGIFAIIVMIIKFNDMEYSRILKFIVSDTLLISFGLTDVYRSLNINFTKEDKQNYDEREKLVNMKSESVTFKIIFYTSALIMISSSILLSVTKNDIFLGILVGMGIILSIIVISVTSTYFYYQKRS